MEQQKQLHLIMEWDLQWFAKDGPGGEKTEPATAKKLREAREDGKVVKSKELTAAFDLIILFLVLKIFVSFVGNRLMNSFVDIYGRIPDFVRENAVDVTEKSVAALMSDALIQILIVCVPFFAFGFVVTALISVIQVGWKVTGNRCSPNSINLIQSMDLKEFFQKILFLNWSNLFLKFLLSSMWHIPRSEVMHRTFLSYMRSH